MKKIFPYFFMIFFLTFSACTKKEISKTPLEKSDELLIEKAKKAYQQAYCPYSNFKVGAAILSKNGEIYLGANIENASYGATICAERVAICNAIINGEKEFESICIMGKGGAYPCGICRQFLNEFSPEIEILIIDEKGNLLDKTSLDKLLPKAFGPKNLK